LGAEKDSTESFTKKILEEGRGWENPRPLWEVHLNIKAMHGDAVFDTNEGEGQPRTYILGSSGLPNSLENAIQKMKLGEKARVEVKQAYGDTGLPDKVLYLTSLLLTALFRHHFDCCRIFGICLSLVFVQDDERQVEPYGWCSGCASQRGYLLRN
jgi:hypothetical protein